MGVGGNGNLIPPKKGEVRNPKGRGKGVRNRQTIFKEMLERVAFKEITKKQSTELSQDGELIEQGTVADQVAAAVLIQALKGDIPAAREIMDSGYGKLTDKLDNLHSFTAMGRVTATLSTGEGEEEKEAIALSFDVGGDPLHDKEDG